MPETNGMIHTPPPSQPQPTPHLPSPPPNTQTPLANQFYTTSATGPPTSLSDPGTSTRPRDARTLHLILASLGVAAYQERVPLQLLDFAYRYTSSVLSDAAHLVAEGYTSSASTGRAPASGEITLAALRLATSSRLGYQFSGALPKETLLELAAERNKVRLPAVDKEGVQFGVRLPHERFVMNGIGWGMEEEWDSGESEVDGEGDAVGVGVAGKENGVKAEEGGVEGEGGEDEDMEDEDGDGGYEQIFGADAEEQEEAEADQSMEDG